MNKYQEALDRCNYVCGLDINVLKKQEFAILQELVNKEKPMLVQTTREITYNAKSYGTRTLKIECPNCKKAFHIVFDNEYKYCPRCGQALDWSDEDE